MPNPNRSVQPLLTGVCEIAVSTQLLRLYLPVKRVCHISTAPGIMPARALTLFVFSTNLGMAHGYDARHLHGGRPEREPSPPSRLRDSVCPTWCTRPDTGEVAMDCCGAFNSSWFWKRRAEVEARCSDNPWDAMGTGEGVGGGVWLQMHWSVMVPAAIRIVPASLGAREQLVGTIYHFGVYNGRSLLELLKWFPFAPHYAFDSFVGLPNEASDEKWVQKNFHAGAYATRNARAPCARGSVGAPQT